MSHRRLWACVAVIAFVGAALILSLRTAITAPQQEFDQALRTWERHAPANYQLDFQISGDEVSGTFRAEIAGAQVRSLIDIASGQPAPEATLSALKPVLPIEHLFERIVEALRPADRLDAELVRRNPSLKSLLNAIGIRPYTCWLPTAEQISYDKALGYPRHLSWSNNRCDGGMFSLDSFDLEITALRPLP